MKLPYTESALAKMDSDQVNWWPIISVLGKGLHITFYLRPFTWRWKCGGLNLNIFAYQTGALFLTLIIFTGPCLLHCIRLCFYGTYETTMPNYYYYVILNARLRKKARGSKKHVLNCLIHLHSLQPQILSCSKKEKKRKTDLFQIFILCCNRPKPL